MRQSNIVFTKKVRAGKRRTYFIDVWPTRSNDYYLTITESKKRFDEDGYERHKIFLYKEDFNKFVDALSETVSFVKTELMPEYDFDEFSKPYHERVAKKEKAAEQEKKPATPEPSETAKPEEDATEEAAKIEDNQHDGEAYPPEDELKWD